MAVIDCVTFNGEYDLFELRYQILKNHVDQFIVVEFDKTFSGKDKEPTFPDRFGLPNWKQKKKDWIMVKDKVKYFYVEESQWPKYLEEAKKSPNTQYGKGAEHWVREWAQKESIKDCLTHLKDNDIVFIGDCDEIWDPIPNVPNILYTESFKCKLKVYTYFLNNRSNEEFWGTLQGQWKDIKNKCLNHLRSNAPKRNDYLGWHFTSMAGALRRKLEDSYTSETYAPIDVLEHLEDSIANNKDFLGRDFKYWIDESDWPQYLKDNREKYAHLCKMLDN